MNGRNFSLQPFPSTAAFPSLEITGSIARSSHMLIIRYVLTGLLEELAIPRPSAMPGRKDRLWEKTCFEFFLAARNCPKYWEFNLSPAGHWNVYRFEAYRQGMQEEKAFLSLPFDVRTQPESLTLMLQVDLNRIVEEEQALEVAVSAVIRRRGGEAGYWALTHCSRKADFHCRNSFIIQL